MHAACELTAIIRKEQEEGNTVVLNFSGSLRTFSIAGYISGCMTQSRAITVIPKYNDDDEEIGIESIIDLPILPVTPLRKEHVDIITAIGDGVSSLDELVFRLNPQLKKTSEEFPKERSRLSHHIKNFESMGLIVKEKSGKNVGIKLTTLGEMLK